MRDFQERRKTERLIYSKWTAAVLIVLFAWGIKATWGVYQKEQLTKENLVKAQRELETLTQRQQALSAKIDQLKSPEGVEEEIRNKFGLVKEGEQVAVIVDSNTDSEPVAAPATSTPSWWENVKGWLGW